MRLLPVARRIDVRSVQIVRYVHQDWQHVEFLYGNVCRSRYIGEDFIVECTSNQDGIFGINGTFGYLWILW